MEAALAKKPRSKVLERAVFALACAPIAWLGVAALTGRLTADPIAFLLNQLGLTALQVLLASLACTPLQQVFGWKWPLRLRRMLGLFAFFYACAHFLTYSVLDQGLAVGEIWKDVVKRKFITIGMATFAILLPLAVTSTNKMVKRLGFHRWKLLHRLVYLAGALAVVHFYWRVKKDHTEPLVYGAILALLLGVRLVSFMRMAINDRAKRSSLAG